MIRNIILPITPTFTSDLFSFNTSDQNFVVLCIFSTRATGLAHLNPTDLIAPIISCEIRGQDEYKVNAKGIFLYVKHQKQSKDTITERYETHTAV
jgi:hypothetical protein